MWKNTIILQSITTFALFLPFLFTNTYTDRYFGIANTLNLLPYNKSFLVQ